MLYYTGGNENAGKQIIQNCVLSFTEQKSYRRRTSDKNKNAAASRNFVRESGSLAYFLP